MKGDEELDVVSFVTLQDGDDLIVSFAIADEEPGEIMSLILLRTPKYEALLPADERGVSVSHESLPENEDPVSRWIPEFARMERPTLDTPPLTIRQLLSHSAGFPEDNPKPDGTYSPLASPTCFRLRK
ncbi:MAG: hypothetical protein A3H97_04290 [Acidobacteria bacterium RIFCSPLOWO2_02_FULL_65_29]|nr:MAG: hypothetical protein A3H97_04290 [Acidobacteria bacterium RIFCSPLOWO2_02_FULL_65_29]